MLDTLEAIFVILMPLLLIAAIINGIMMRVRLRKLKQLLAADGRCTRCCAFLDATGKCAACDKKM